MRHFAAQDAIGNSPVGTAVDKPVPNAGRDRLAVVSSLSAVAPVATLAGLLQRVPEDKDIEVTLVRTDDQLEAAVRIRAQAYGRHAPEMLDILREAEPNDLASEAVVFLARDRVSGETLGSMRVMTNLQEPLPFELEIELPEAFRGRTISVVQRLAVAAGAAGIETKKRLFKAYYLYSIARQVEWLILYTLPPRDRLFARLGFTQVFPGEGIVKGRFSDFRPVRFLALKTWEVEPLWKRTVPEWHRFFFEQRTESIKIFSSVANRSNAFRRALEPEREPMRG